MSFFSKRSKTVPMPMEMSTNTHTVDPEAESLFKQGKFRLADCDYVITNTGGGFSDTQCLYAIHDCKVYNLKWYKDLDPLAVREANAIATIECESLNFERLPSPGASTDDTRITVYKVQDHSLQSLWSCAEALATAEIKYVLTVVSLHEFALHAGFATNA